MSRRKSKRQSSSGVGRLFFWTAALGVVFSAGLITGQRILLEEALPPIVSVNTSTPSLTTRGAPLEEEAKDSSSFFSFYDVLNTPEIREIAQRVQPITSRREERSPTPEPQRSQAPPAQEVPSVAVEQASQEEHTEREVPFEEEAAQIPAESAAPVEAVLDPAPAVEQAPARYTLQVASHPTMERARAEMDRLRGIGLDPHVVSAEVPGQGVFYRVRIGKYHSMEQARAAQQQVQATQEVQTFVTPL